MDLFTWNDSYSLDIKSIDDDHKGLLDLINKLFDAMRQGKAKEILKDILEQLTIYTKTHFKREEMYFKSITYPDFEEHKLQHDQFVSKIHELKKQLDSGDSSITVDLIKYLSEWLINHILISDKKYKYHFLKSGIK